MPLNLNVVLRLHITDNIDIHSYLQTHAFTSFPLLFLTAGRRSGARHRNGVTRSVRRSLGIDTKCPALLRSGMPLPLLERDRVWKTSCHRGSTHALAVNDDEANFVVLVCREISLLVDDNGTMYSLS